MCHGEDSDLVWVVHEHDSVAKTLEQGEANARVLQTGLRSMRLGCLLDPAQAVLDLKE